MDINKKLPVWALILLDLLLVAAIILPFAYFHHVRDMLGISPQEQGKRSYTDETPDPLTAEVFLPTESETPSGSDVSPGSLEPAVIEGDGAIRAYARENSLPLSAVDGASYLKLYRSADVYAVLYTAKEYPDGFAVRYYIYDVYVRNVRNFFTVNSRQKSMRELIAEGEENTGGRIIAAVNGDYSSNKNHCRVVVRNGVLYRSPEIIDSDVCVMYGDGSIETYTPEEFDFAAVEKRNPYQIWDFGPELLDKNGKAKTRFDDEAYDRHILKNTHPRTALGYYEPGHYCLIVADGRQNDEDGEYLYGCSVKSLAALCQRLGCRRAYNMDGGASTQAYMDGEDVRIDHGREEQRVLSDIICVGEVPGTDSGDDGTTAGKEEGV